MMLFMRYLLLRFVVLLVLGRRLPQFSRYNTIEIMLSKDLTKKKFPDNPGVYIFRDYRKRPLYIGRATSLRGRVKSYADADLIVTRGPRLVDMVTKAKSITWQTADSVLEAILLETALIKRYQPPYNVDERDDKSSQYVVITEEEWPRVFLARARDLDHGKKEGNLPFKIKKCYGPFLEINLIREALAILRKMFPFRDKKAHDPRHEAFYRALGKSPEKDSREDHERYLQTIDYLILFFEGKKTQLRKELQREMQCCAAELRFEDANRVKRLLYALDHINDISLIKRGKQSDQKGDFRIEAYDVAHLAGREAVGSMTVSCGGNFTPAEYRMFKLSRNANDDTAGLREILSRRLNHTEWTFPDLIVVDGNEVQLRNAEGVLAARRMAIPVVAVTKDERHKASRLIGHPDLIKVYKNDIIALNAEVHRFTITYHRKRMRKSFV
jgi:excinuclease ABC subunit C